MSPEQTQPFETIKRVIEQVRRDKELPPAELSATAHLADDLELDSLDMATVVAELEALLGLDPFADDTPVFETLGEFAALYAARPA